MAIARALDANAFGAFSLAYAMFALALGVSRAFFGLPISSGAAAHPGVRAQLFGNSVGALAIVALPLAGLVVVVPLAIVQLERDALLAVVAVAVATPVILVQDVARYHAIADRRAGWAVSSDALWLLGAGLLLLLPVGTDLRLVLGVWVFVIVASAAVGVLPMRPRWSWREAGRLLRLRLGLRESVVVTVVLSGLVGLIVAAAVAPVLGVEAVGALRGAGTVFGPINAAIVFLDFAVLSQVVRRDGRDRARLMIGAAAAIVVLTLVWSATLLLAPSEWGEQILGDTWEAARAVLPITAVEYVFLGIVAVMSLSLKADDRSLPLVATKATSSASILIAVIIALAVGPSIESIAASLLVGSIVAVAVVAAAIRLRPGARSAAKRRE